MDCQQCNSVFDPIATRWLCPHCGLKASCCEGAPLDLDAVISDLEHRSDRARN